MAKEAKEETVSFAELMATEGNSATVVDPDPLNIEQDDPEVLPRETPLDDMEPVTDDAQPTGDEEGNEKSDTKPGWDPDRQKRDQERAERQKAVEVKVEGLTTMVEELSGMNRQLLAKLVQGAGKADDEAEEAPSSEPGALVEAISKLDPEEAEFADLLKTVNAIIDSAQGGKATSADLRKALADQDKRHKEELAEQARRLDDRDAKDADRAAQDAYAGHLDNVMLTMFKGKHAMRKTVEKRAFEIIADHGYGPKEQVPLRTAKMAVTSAGKEVAARLVAEARDRETPAQDNLAGGGFVDGLSKGAQTTKEAMGTMGSRAL